MESQSAINFAGTSLFSSSKVIVTEKGIPTTGNRKISYSKTRGKSNCSQHNTQYNCTEHALSLPKVCFLARRECLPGFCFYFGGGIDEVKIHAHIYNKIIICEDGNFYFLQSNVNLLDSQPHKIFLSGFTQLCKLRTY